MFSGLMPAMVTPFDERGDADLGATEALVERFIEAGVDGISPLGSTGEASHLTGDERKRFAEEVTRIVAGRVPLLIGVGAVGTPLDPDNVSHLFSRICWRAGLGHWHLHELRHSGASLMLAQGTDLYVVSEVLGHSSVAITSTGTRTSAPRNTSGPPSRCRCPCCCCCRRWRRPRRR